MQSLETKSSRPRPRPRPETFETETETSKYRSRDASRDRDQVSRLHHWLLEVQGEVLKTQVLIKFVVIWSQLWTRKINSFLSSLLRSTSSNVQGGVNNLLFTDESWQKVCEFWKNSRAANSVFSLISSSYNYNLFNVSIKLL